MALMTVYHGGHQAIEKPEIRVNKNTKDFGTGFYCAIIKEQAQRWCYNERTILGFGKVQISNSSDCILHR